MVALDCALQGALGPASSERCRASHLLQKKSRNEVLRQAVMKLSPDHREIIDLVYYHEKSVDDCATILGIPAATVKPACSMAARSWLSWSRGGVSPIIFWGGVRRLWRKLGPPYPILSGAMWPGGHIEKFSERLTDCLLVGLNLAGATVPPLDCQAFKAPLSPRRGLLLEPTAR